MRIPSSANAQEKRTGPRDRGNAQDYKPPSARYNFLHRVHGAGLLISILSRQLGMAQRLWARRQNAHYGA